MKKIVITISIVLLIIVLVIFMRKGKNDNTQTVLDDENLYFNEETTKYEVYDDDGKLLVETADRATAEFYLEHPDYEPLNSEYSEDMINTDEFGNYITFESIVPDNQEITETPFE